MRSGAEGRPWLRAVEVTKAYGGVLALDAASLDLRAGEVRGLVGANGAGKTTLVRVLTGLVAPSSGRVLVDGRALPSGRPKESLRAGIASVPQELVLAPSATVAENVMLGHEPRGRLGFLDARAMSAAARDVLEWLELETPVDALAGRLPLIEQRLVMVARALSFHARLVIFDEPTATVSPREVDLVLGAIRRLAARGVSVLYVSHRLDEVEAVCETVTVLRDGRVVADKRERASHAELVELLSPARAGAAGVTVAGAARPPAGDVVLTAEGLRSERLRDVSLAARAGEVVGLAGVAGSGARELLLAVCGAVPFAAGTVRVVGRRVPSGQPVAAVAAGVGFLPGDRSLAAFATHSVGHNVSIAALSGLARGPFVAARSERTAVEAVLDRVSLRARPETPISSLSGGNQQKAIVARWIASGAKLLLLDDPTAGVDVATRPEIHAQIRGRRDAGAAVLLVSTDLDELVELADRVVVFDRGAVVGTLAGADLTPSRLLAAMTGRAAAPASVPTNERSAMSEAQSPPPPTIPDAEPQEIAARVFVLPDERIDLVPNVGIVVGDEAALVIDTGMGAANGRTVLQRARALAGDRPLLLTLTHFHPEHGFGAQAFRGEATLLYNEAQRDELVEKFGEFVEMFRGFGPGVAEALEGVELVEPRVVYASEAEIGLGGVAVRLSYHGPAHTRGDQVIFLPEERILFAGDLVENRFFPILPDADAHGSAWIELLERLERLDPAIVVPGHGEVGDASLIRAARDYLAEVRDAVAARAAEERPLDEIKAELEPEIRERYADWDNPIWIGFAIENFHGELGGR